MRRPSFLLLTRPVPVCPVPLCLVLAGLLFVAACSGGSSKHATTASTTTTGAASTRPSASAGSSPSVTTATSAGDRTVSGAVTVAPAGWQLPGALDREVVLNDGKDLFVLGGRNAAKTSTPAIHHLAASTGRSLGEGTLGVPVHDAAGAVLGGSHFVFGGGNSATVAAVQRFAPGNGARVVGQLPQPRSDLVAATVGDRAFVAGGYDGTKDVATVLSTKDGTNFTTVGTLPTLVRYPAMVNAGGVLWVIGGETSSGGDTNVIQRIDPASGAVTIASHYPNTIGHEGVAVLGGHVYVIGGRVGGAISDHVVELDPATGTTKLVGHLPAPLSDMAVTVLGDTAYVVGGESAASSPTAGVTTIRLG